MKIMAFCTTMNARSRAYPFIESIKSFLPVLDGLVVVDGGSTDGTVEMIKLLDNPKISVIQPLKGEDWNFANIGKSFNAGAFSCSESGADVVMKFDVDHVLHQNIEAHENKGLRRDLEAMVEQDQVFATFNRVNVLRIDQIYGKAQRILAINNHLIKNFGLDICYGMDPKAGWFGFTPILRERTENGIHLGRMITTNNFSGREVYGTIYNYDYAFRKENLASMVRMHHCIGEAETFAQSFQEPKMNEVSHICMDDILEDPHLPFSKLKTQYASVMDRVAQIHLEDHPAIMHDKIKAMEPGMFGYDMWGQVEPASYFV